MTDESQPPQHPAEKTLPIKERMIGGVIRFCLENKLVVGLFLIGVMAAGAMVAPFDWDLGSLPRSAVPVDAIPDLGENQQIVFTEWMGRSPQDVEDQITYPLTVALLGVPGVKTIRSSSFFGFSSIYVIFDEEIEFYWSRTRILEKLNSLPAGTLPDGVQPALGPDATPLGQIFWYTLEGRDPEGNPIGGWDLNELRSIQDWNVRYHLLAAEGISEVASIGGFVQEYQIDVDPDAMRAARVGLGEIFMAVRNSNIDVGARTIEVNKAEYFIRGRGFVEQLEDLEYSVVAVNENVPIYVKDVANVTMGPALRRGVLDKGGAEAVGGVVVVRYGYNPLAAIKHVQEKIKEIEPGLPTHVVIDWRQTTRDEVDAYAGLHDFAAFDGTVPKHTDWVAHLRSLPRDQRPSWANTSQITVEPFYDRTGLIYETLGTLNTALVEEILITVIVIIVSVMHLRSSILISMLLPVAVLMCFVGMKVFGVDANIVALSGIAIAIGTMVDMGIILCENILRHLDEADANEDRMEVILRGSREVGAAVLTAVSTTVVSFLPVFTMIGAEGKLFRPLALTKTFALVASVLVALLVIPPAAHVLFTGRIKSKTLERIVYACLVIVGMVVAVSMFWWVGVILIALGGYKLAEEYLPQPIRRIGPWSANIVAVLVVGVLLTRHWLPLGPARGLPRNLIFVATLIGGLLAFFQIFQHWVYKPLLRWCLAHKLLFLTVPALVLLAGLTIWLGPQSLFGPINRVSRQAIGSRAEVDRLITGGLLEERRRAESGGGDAPARAAAAASTQPAELFWTAAALKMSRDEFRQELARLKVQDAERLVARWSFASLTQKEWGKPDFIRDEPPATRLRWTLAQSWQGLGNEFMPPLDEGSYLYMPATMVHASIGEALNVLQLQDRRIMSIPEVELAVGKIGRVESPLDPAPVSMIETVVNYKPEYIVDKDGHRTTYRFQAGGDDWFRNEAGMPVPAIDGGEYRVRGRFERDEQGNLIEDPGGVPFRQWRPPLDPEFNPGREAWSGIQKPDDIWEEIKQSAQIPGTTSAPKLQPIAARLVMLQSGMRAPMGVKIKGPDLETIERVALQIEGFLKEVESVEAQAVIADRIVGKPYLIIDFDRKKIARYGLTIRDVQDVVEVAIGGRRVTTTVEGRERYPVRIRYLRELRSEVETLGKILVPAKDGSHIPLTQLAEIEYERGPQVIKSEDTFLIGYVLFDMRAGNAEVDVVEASQRYLQEKIDSGQFVLPPGVSYTFAGNYENQQRAQKTLTIVLPLALFIIFLILYFQFRSVIITLVVFSGIAVAWSGGFIMLWLYGQPWFLDFDVFGANIQTLFQIHPINLSIAIWVGFLALFGIATDDGVVITTYLDQSFFRRRITTPEEARAATLVASLRRVRPCLMTIATTILALIPVLTSTGRGADIMVPMAIPSFGGMTIAIMTMLIVPVLYCAVQEWKIKLKIEDPRFAEHS